MQLLLLVFLYFYVNTDGITADIFKITFLHVLNKFAPLKKKYLRANHSRFVNKELDQAIMQRSRLRTAYLKDKTGAARITYNKQRNVCLSIWRESKKFYYKYLDTKDITNNEKFRGYRETLFFKQSKIRHLYAAFPTQLKNLCSLLMRLKG